MAQGHVRDSWQHLPYRPNNEEGRDPLSLTWWDHVLYPYLLNTAWYPRWRYMEGMNFLRRAQDGGGPSFQRITMDCQVLVMRYLPIQTVYALALTTSDGRGRSVFNIHSRRCGLYSLVLVHYREEGTPAQVLALLRLAWQPVDLPEEALTLRHEEVAYLIEQDRLPGLQSASRWDTALEGAPPDFPLTHLQLPGWRRYRRAFHRSYYWMWSGYGGYQSWERSDWDAGGTDSPSGRTEEANHDDGEGPGTRWARWRW